MSDGNLLPTKPDPSVPSEEFVARLQFGREVFSLAKHLIEISRLLERSEPPIVKQKILKAVRSFINQMDNLVSGKDKQSLRDLVAFHLTEQLIPEYQRFRKEEISYRQLRDSIIVTLKMYPTFMSCNDEQVIGILDRYLAKDSPESLSAIMDGNVDPSDEGGGPTISGPVEAASLLVGRLLGMSPRKVRKIRESHEKGQSMEVFGVDNSRGDSRSTIFFLQKTFGFSPEIAGKAYQQLLDLKDATDSGLNQKMFEEMMEFLAKPTDDNPLVQGMKSIARTLKLDRQRS